VSQKPKAKSSRTQLFLRNFHLYDILALPVVALDGNQANNVTLRIIVIIIIINEYLEVSIPDLKFGQMHYNPFTLLTTFWQCRCLLLNDDFRLPKPKLLTIFGLIFCFSGFLFLHFFAFIACVSCVCQLLIGLNERVCMSLL